MLLIVRNLGVVELATNQPLGVEHRVLRVRAESVLHAVTDTGMVLLVGITPVQNRLLTVTRHPRTRPMTV